MTSIAIRNFKSIGRDFVGLTDVSDVNVIIGKNNIGKTAILDAIEFSCSINFKEIDYRKKRKDPVAMQFRQRITSNHIKIGFRENVRGGTIGIDHYQYGKDAFSKIGNILEWEVDSEGNFKQTTFSGVENEYANSIAKSIKSPFWQLKCVRVDAERDVVAEAYDRDLKLNGNGSGLTNIIRDFLLDSKKPRRVVEENVLGFINTVLHPDAYFEKIYCLQDRDSQKWEIFFSHYGETIALSSMGTGIKTIVLVATIFEILCAGYFYEAKKSILCIEEVENNLHPSMQRRLCEMLYRKSVEMGIRLFMTTHSGIVVDFFAERSNAKLFHFIKRDKSTVCEPVVSRDSQRRVLDDIQVRASDILQTNVIVWVEGPSDKTFISKWISLFSNGEIQEGFHYRCLFYGGRLLSHLMADSDDKDLIDILEINRNSIVIMDSDKRWQSAPINSTKKRIVHELDSVGGLTWVTKGREIENYITTATSERFFGRKANTSLKLYENYYDWAARELSDDAKKLESNKASFAVDIARFMENSALENNHDVKENIDRIVRFIRRANE